MNTHQVNKFVINLLLITYNSFNYFTAVHCDFLLIDPVDIGSNRVIHSEINPGCPRNLCDNVTIIYTTSDNSSTRDHHFWSSLPNESPSFFVVGANGHNSAKVINWEKLLSNNPSESINLGDVRSAIGLSVNRIFFWDDPESDGNFNRSSDLIEVKDFKNVLTNTSFNHKYDDSSSHAAFLFGEPGTNLTVKIIVSTQANGGRADQLPQLTFNDRSLNFEIVINGTSSVDYKKNRVGIELSLVHSGDKFEPKSVASIDDEFSPGVFAEWSIQFRNEVNESNYLKWKAVGYNKPDRIIAHTVDTSVRIDKNETDLPTSTLDRVMKGFFGDHLNQSIKFAVTKFNMTFETGEEYYSKTNYTSFSFVMAMGQYTEEEGLSFLVKIIIITGFGIPVIAIIASALYLSVKRYRRPSYREVDN